jgi:hypothetical protein
MLSVMSYDRKQQIELVLKGELRTILREKYGPPPHTTEQIRESVDFSRDKALEHIREFGFPPGSYTRGDSGADGIHLDSEKGIWKIWFSERGASDLKFENSDPEVTQEALMDLMIYLSGLVGPIHFTEKFELSPMQW